MPHLGPTADEPQPFIPASQEEAENAAAHQGGEVSTVDLEQLQLIELCFSEHEFGVVLDSDGTKGYDDGCRGSHATANYDASDAFKQTGGGPRGEVTDSAIATFDFDPVRFVQNKLSHGVPLSDLCRDLETYTSILNKIILRHVNSDVHDAFVKVSGHLVGMQDDLRLVQHPVAAAVRRVEDNIAKLDDMENALFSQIAEATELEIVRMFDVTFLKVLLLHDLLRGQLEALPSALRLTDDEGSQRRRQMKPEAPRAVAAMAGSENMIEALRNISGLVRQLKSLKCMLPHLSQREEEEREMEHIVDDAVQQVRRVLARVYLAVHEESALSSSEEIRKSLLNIMLLYKDMDEVHEFCVVYREQVLRPLIESVLSWRAATQARHSLVDTVNLLHALRQQLEKDVLPFVSVLREAFGQGLLPIPTVVCPVVLESLLKKMFSLYDTGDPDAFQQRYVAAHEVLGLMQISCTSDEELRTLLQSPDVVLWEQRWNTDVYGAMRVNALTKQLDAVINGFVALTPEQHAERIDGLRPQEELAPGSEVVKVAFSTELFSRLRELIEWLFSSGVYIYVVTPKYLREVANVVRRVAKTIVEHSAAGRSIGSLRDWLCMVMVLCSDVNQFGAYLEGSFLQRLRDVTQGNVTETFYSQYLSLLVQQTCHGCVKQLHQLLLSRVVEACGVGLQNVRSVKSAYAHTRKPFPTEASWYMASVIGPLQQFATEVQLRLPREVGLELMNGVTTEVVDMFRTIARDTLITAKRTEDSWGKLRRRKELTGGGELATAASVPPTANARPTPQTATDRDKMTLQLYLDASLLVKEIEELLASRREGETGVQVEKLPCVTALHKLLQRARWILGEDMQEPPDVDEVDA